MPGELESATEVEIVRLPAGCSFGPGGRLEAPLVISDPAVLASAITCPSGTAEPTVDLASGDVLLVSFTMSPAYGGMAIVDDGTTVTFVMRDRPPCPDDPRPMPMSSDVAFRLPHGATRAYRELSCSLPRRCG